MGLLHGTFERRKGVFLTTNWFCSLIQAFIWAAKVSYSREVVGGGTQGNRQQTF